jgi:hypothetical protein
MNTETYTNQPPLLDTYNLSTENFFSRSIKKIKPFNARTIIMAGTMLLLLGAAYMIYELQPELEKLHFEG